MEDQARLWPGEDIGALVRVNPVGENLFTNEFTVVPPTRSLFGGQVMAQALGAAIATAPAGFAPHAVHALFIGAGDPVFKVTFAVEKIRQGRSFAVSRVRATQNDRVLLELLVSFHAEETGPLNHEAIAPPDIPPPEETMTLGEFADHSGNRLARKLADLIGSGRTSEVRPCSGIGVVEGELAGRRFWMRIKGAEGVTDDATRYQLILYLSDMWLGGTATAAHHDKLGDAYPRMISLDHAIWLHRPADPSGWLLYDMQSPIAGSNVGLNLGAIYDRDGKLVANVGQQSLVRVELDG